MKKLVLNLEPLTCPSCIKKIEGALKRLDGISEAKVLFNSGKVRAEFDENKVSVEEIANTVSGLGYPIVSQKVS
ncbi:heavy-metal-associated domain-containing protein [Sporosarcina oncorhynchi]|uniref:Heavy-metal-associated domain-containing protein n=1 Tax=Sporosarcina oncorhynchi TaxID=3056444 RepID=A0ABZ0L4Q0_9BACL|nr:heavy-metal-associated domain-containing protein [Sporosarcina sp. T2O-4]WOV87182.1 heavy-metal-associated domain-containing protein [Sporosarcina sp. T2O-4]